MLLGEGKLCRLNLFFLCFLTRVKRVLDCSLLSLAFFSLLFSASSSVSPTPMVKLASNNSLAECLQAGAISLHDSPVLPARTACSSKRDSFVSVALKFANSEIPCMK